jgi:hypothetical protein
MKTAQSLINPQLVKRLKEIDELKKSLYDYLGITPEMVTLWPILKNQELTILTDSPIFATQLRFQRVSIATFLKQKYSLNITVVHTKLLSPQKAIPVLQKKTIKPGLSAQKSIKSIANLINDKELRDALIKLTT